MLSDKQFYIVLGVGCFIYAAASLLVIYLTT